MSNSLNSNPATFTGTQGSFKSAIASSQGSFATLLIEKVYWLNPGSVGDTAAITDPITGATLLSLRCEVAGQSQIVDWTASPKLWADFALSQISSGTIEIYFR